MDVRWPSCEHTFMHVTFCLHAMFSSGVSINHISENDIQEFFKGYIYIFKGSIAGLFKGHELRTWLKQEPERDNLG